MSPALTFATPLLLVGLAAAAIPVLLHLLQSVRAPEVYFPTLRFLRASMDKTARRRRLEHWVLLVIRSLLLALLALAVAEPILRASGGFWADRRCAAVVIVDNSYSMAVRSEGSSRFDRARLAAARLLGADRKPSLAALMLTNGARPPQALARNFENLRAELARARLASGRANIPECIDHAVRLLKGETLPQKAIYLFTDLQRISLEGLGALEQLRKQRIPLLLVDCSRKPPVNVGISELRITGRRVVDQALEATATLVNSSPTDKLVEVWLQVDGQPRGEPVRKMLRAAGKPGARSIVRFHHRFSTPGPHFGQVAIDVRDDLPADNVRRFAVEIAPRVPVLLVRPASAGAGRGTLDPASWLQVALDPFAGAAASWSIRPRTLTVESLSADVLAGARAVFLADVPAFTPAQASAIVDFVRAGGTAVLFLGPAVDTDNYNRRFVQEVPFSGGLLPGRLEQAHGQVGLTARALRAVKNLRHPYLAGLYETPADYPEVLIQRYYRVRPSAGRMEAILSAPGGDPIVSTKRFGRGRVVLFATTASPEWNNLATTPIFLPMIVRICLQAGEQPAAEHTYPAGAAVHIRPRGKLPEKAAVNVSLPDGSVQVLPLDAAGGASGITFTNTHAPGVYHWQLAGASPGPNQPASAPGPQPLPPPGPAGSSGVFVTNIDGVETDLTAVPLDRLRGVLKSDLYAGATLAEVHAAAAEAAAGENIWDRLLVVVILLLVVEAVVANRFRRGSGPVPAHLNPRIAT